MIEFLRLAGLGIVGGLVVFAAISPLVVGLQRRRFGRVRGQRILGIAVICMYTMLLAGMTVAPSGQAEVCTGSGILQPVPLHSLAEVIEVARLGVGPLGVLLSWPSMQLLANIALFMPLGAILRGVFRLDTTTALAMGVMLSVLIEATQFTGGWGLYPCGERTADIDDVFTNSLGTWLGAMCAPMLTRLGTPLFGRPEPPAPR
ncbi:VanZ family protein [Brachybacterium squillarum]|uniref:VanZ family protein n=1 Tax=Brachybacterium squillarum TaxID=661979 RepID=UPI00026293FE|nr:VanZ family protein [Brachybacterium squillarum]